MIHATIHPKKTRRANKADIEQCRNIGQSAYDEGFQAIYYESSLGVDYALCVFERPAQRLITTHESQTGHGWLRVIDADDKPTRVFRSRRLV